MGTQVGRLAGAVSVASGKVGVRTRNGNDVTSAVPEVAGLGEALFGISVVLDGELVGHTGTPSSFYRLSGRMAARRPAAVEGARRRTPVTFAAFDVLWLDGNDITREPYWRRRELLVDLGLVGPAWCTVSSFENGPELFAACTALGLEGVVAKRIMSSYEPGARSKHWIKAKCADWLQVHARHRHN